MNLLPFAHRGTLPAERPAVEGTQDCPAPEGGRGGRTKESASGQIWTKRKHWPPPLAMAGQKVYDTAAKYL